MSKVKNADFALEPPQMTILSDHPSQSSDDDFLRMESRLAVVLDILRHQHTRCPITIAIYGDWGTGKTSAMHWLESQLQQWNHPDNKKRGNHPRVYPVWFDPWKYHSREEVWRGIIAEVILALFNVGNLDKKNFVPRMKEAAKQFGAFLGKSFLHALAHLKINAGEAEVSGEMFRDIFEEYEKTNRPEKAHLNQFEDTLKHWVKSFLKSDERIALFIDDLDRCMPEVTLEVLEAIKLYLNIPQIMFVVGVDRDVVDGIVIKHYDTHGLGKEKARQYLDKIFQVEIQISPSEQQIKEFLSKQVNALDKSTGGYWKQKLAEDHRQALEAGIRELARHNPRETKRLLNSALLRGRAAADNPDLCEKFDEPLLFAQGVQLFLIQRIIQNWLSNGRNLLREDEALEWFERWSKVVQEFPEFRPIRETVGEALKSTSERNRPESVAERSYSELKKLRLIGDDFKPVDKLLLLEDELLWQLLRIPFSAEVAQSVPKFKEPPSVLASLEASMIHAGENLEDAGNTLSSVIRDRIAKHLKKPVTQLTSTDLKEVKQLALNGADISDAEIVHLARLTSLQSLDLSGSKMTDSGLAHLTKLTTLQTLNLNRTQVGDAGLVHLTELTSLQKLDLNGTQVGDAGLAHLTKLTTLQKLDLNGTQVGDAGLAHLTRLTALQTLDLSETQVGDAGLAHLAKLTALQILNLKKTQVGDAGLAHLTKLTSLRQLDLSEIKIRDEALRHLTKLKTLDRLALEGTQVTDASMLHLSKITTLEDLNLSGTKVGDAGLAHLVTLSALTSLALEGTQVTNAGLIHLGKLVKLDWLDLDRTQVTDAGLPNLDKLTSLGFLWLQGTAVSKNAAQKLNKKLGQVTIELGSSDT